MHLRKRTREEISHFISKGEEVIMETRQSYWASVSPDSIVATDSKIVAVLHSFWGLHFGRNVIGSTNVGVVPYKNIIGVEVSHGRLLSTVRLHLVGPTSGEKNHKNIWILDGLRRNNAMEIMDIIRKKIEAGAARPG